MRQSCLLLTVALLISACATGVPITKPPAPTAEDAAKFVAGAESALAILNVEQQRNEWVQENFITYDTQILASQATATPGV